MRKRRLVPVSITFDDGTKFQYNKFYPVLSEYEINATFFIVTSQIGRPGRMTWGQLEDLYKHGNEIGSHTHTHPHLTEISEHDLEYELRKSRALLDSFGCKTLAYPFGECNRKVIDNAKRYYVAARSYYDLTMKSRNYGHNFGLAGERYKLKVFPTENVFPPYTMPLLELTLARFQQVIRDVIEEGIKRKAWTIFVFHGQHDLTFGNIIDNIHRQVNAVMKSIIHINELANNAMRLRGKLSKFRWMCKYLASHNQLEVFPVSEVIRDSYLSS